MKRLVVHTEGWPVGIYLAGLSLTRKGHVDAAIREFHGDDRMVADYVRDEFLAELDDETLDFLIESSVLDRLTGEVCDAVLDRKGSAEMLHQLVRSNLLIIPLDTRDRAYRHHALLQEMLESELGRRDASVSARLHERASSWFREQGDVDRAISHAVQAGDREVCRRADLAELGGVRLLRPRRNRPRLGRQLHRGAGVSVAAPLSRTLDGLPRGG